MSHPRWRTPLNEWKRSGAARRVFPAYLTIGGRVEMNSMIAVDATASGATTYAIAYPYRTVMTESLALKHDR